MVNKDTDERRRKVHSAANTQSENSNVQKTKEIKQLIQNQTKAKLITRFSYEQRQPLLDTSQCNNGYETDIETKQQQQQQQQQCYSNQAVKQHVTW